METQLQQDFKVDFIYSQVISFAMQQNHIPVIRKFIINNSTENDIQNINVDLNFEPEFGNPVSTKILLLKAGESLQINNFDLRLSPKFLSELTERISGSIKLTIQSEDIVLLKNDYLIDVLAFDQWQGLSILPETISSFITPNNPQISKIISRASEILNKWTGNPSLDEYQSRNPDRVKKQMAAVFESVRELGIVYCTSPASFEDSGQRIRMIDMLLNHKLGTCLDLSLIYTSCLEAIGINSIVVFIKGHAFAGGWLIDDSFPDSINDDPTLLSKRIADGINEILLVEATCMNFGNTNAFDDAVRSANYHLAKSEDFILFVDVKRSRFAGIRPLPQRIKTDLGWEFNNEQKSVTFSTVPEEIFSDNNLVQKEKEFSKQQLWERKLLDLSLRNNLLNTRITRSTIQLISVSLNKLEDALAAGEEFQLLPKPTDWENPLRMAGVYQALNQTDPIIDLVKNELSQRRLRTYLTEVDLVKGLTNVYRSSKLSMEENGANTLYLCLGLLKWYETSVSEQPRFSPLLLLPVDIIRKSALKGFIIRSREEDTLMNITLLEMLRQDFKINIPGLDPLPIDESGVDVKRIFNIIRQAIMVQNRWDIEEQAILGIFSFNKFIMWNDIHNNSDKLVQNKIVSSLISGNAQWDVELNQFSSEDLDVKYYPTDIILPINADSSQFEAISAAGQSKSFILHGPPGTGKSQTITNIIANALYNGKKVLFAAEKMAALSVVQRRLEAIGIASFCLELHSRKSKKSALLEQLKRTTEIFRKAPPEDFNSEAERIFQVRKELNGYVKALHKKYPFGFSLFEAFSGYSTFPEYPINIKFERGIIASLTKEQVRIWSELAEELKAAGIMCGEPHNHLLKEINTESYSSQAKTTASVIIIEYLEALKVLKNSLVEVCNLFNYNSPLKHRSQVNAVNEICSLLVSAQDIPSSLLNLNNLDESLRVIVNISQNGINRNRIRDSLLKTFKKDILDINIERIQAEWSDTLGKWFIPKFLGQNKIINFLKNLSLNKKFEKTSIETIFNDIIEYKKEQNQINIHSAFIAPILGLRWQEGDGDWSEIKNICNDVLNLNNSLLSLTGDSVNVTTLRQALCVNLKEGHKAFLSVHKSTLMSYQDSLTHILEVENKLSDLLIIDFERLELINEIFVENLLQHCNNWKVGIESLRDWVGWNQIKNKVKKAGLDQLVHHFEKGNIKGGDIVSFFIKNLFQNCAEYIIEQDDQLSSFNGKLFEDKIRKYRQFSKDFEKLTKDELYEKLASKVPFFSEEVAQSSEIGILQRNIRNGGRGMSIRKLFDTIPTLITRICPCMLMSPISVAQYIDINNFKFDLIIFDEASQMPTSEAVGAIARGNNLIVVGDPKQMPPTNFFSTNNIDEENIEKEDMESILDDCLALSLPSKHLLWHYRSKHESLITFSNSQFYDNTLLTFPSPDDLITKVKFNQIPGYYDRGRTRQNSFEAKAVIEEILKRLSDPILSKKSIGVVTFSSVQQILIDDMLTEAFKQRPDLEIIATEALEPIFIKNLENVQGDERDVVLFSVGYGPDKENKVNLNFGPLNREGGWRRLNVAVSRARYEMIVFSTLKAEQIDITRTSSLGVAAFKAFLEFAEKGKNSLSIVNKSGKTQGSGFTEQLAKSLREDGFNVLTNIGSSGFKIDLGITNPNVPSEYKLGVLCDGQSYRDLKTAKDREIIQSEVLNLLGWNIHKVWSCDWWDNKDKVLKEIKQAIQNVSNNDTTPIKLETQQVKENSETQTPNYQAIVNDSISQKSKYKANYILLSLPMHSFTPQSDMLSLPHFKETVSNDVLSILQTEAPISKELLCRRVLATWSISRLGSRIDAYFNSLFSQMGIKFSGGERRFYWNANQNPESYSQYRISELESQRRDASDISPEEVSNAIHEILENMISLDRSDLIKEAARIFGFNRIGGNVESSMIEGISKAVKRGFAKIEENRVFLIE